MRLISCLLRKLSQLSAWFCACSGSVTRYELDPGLFSSVAFNMTKKCISLFIMLITYFRYIYIGL
jgi:hypothetical protein